jgi:hypothetical protein
LRCDSFIGQNQPVAPYPRDDTAAGTTDYRDLEKGAVRQPRLAVRLQVRRLPRLCYLEQARCRLISRKGNALNRFNALGDQVALALEVDDAVIDGEVIAADETGRPQFYDLLRGTRAPAYVAFDILWLNGTDLRPLPLSERRRALRAPVLHGPDKLFVGLWEA